jgi:hypothetical protein
MVFLQGEGADVILEPVQRKRPQRRRSALSVDGGERVALSR